MMEHISCMEETRAEYKVLIRNCQRKTSSLRMWEDNIRIDLRKTICYSSNGGKTFGLCNRRDSLAFKNN
jgi:hypothetical protein